MASWDNDPVATLESTAKPWENDPVATADPKPWDKDPVIGGASPTPETDKAAAETTEQAILGRAKAFVQGAGIPTSVEGLKEFGKFLIRNPVQDVKDIYQGITEIPEKVRNIGQTISESPAAKVYRAPLSPESFGTYGTVAGMTVGPKAIEAVKSIPGRFVRGPVEAPIASDVAARTAPEEVPATLIPPEAQTRPSEPTVAQERPSGEPIVIRSGENANITWTGGDVTSEFKPIIPSTVSGAATFKPEAAPAVPPNQVYYHGTRADFPAFDLKYSDLSSRGSSGALGFSFALEKEAAQQYGQRIVPANLDIKNPSVLTEAQWRKATNSRADAKALRAELISQGYDGAIPPKEYEVIAFYPEQIKPVAQGGEPNASQIESTTQANGGVRARGELGQLPEGNVQEPNARLRSDQGERATQPQGNVVEGQTSQPDVQVGPTYYAAGGDEVTRPTRYVQLKYRSVGGTPRTVWAEKLGKNSYRTIDKEGEWGASGTENRILLSGSDLISEKPAGFSKKYGSLKVVTKVVQPEVSPQEAQPVAAGEATPPELPKNKPVTIKALTPEGEELSIKMDAQKAERMITRRKNNLQSLLDCLSL